jgi:Ca2+-transporting ATPase
MDRLARNGMRVLGVAVQPLDAAPVAATADLERDLTFVGLVGMIDPPRAEVADAVRICRTAGIRPVMITGDHALTALHIARQLGIATNDRVLTGQDLDRLAVAELEGVVEQVAVYARVSPEHKLKIVEALQRRGHIVAMTGDGVNDAPALKRADIGVAMGITGTDVSKEAADMVLRDDNFATIVAAVEEGRTIYDNLRKFVKFSIAGNIGKVLTVLLGTALLGPVLGMPLALLPLQLLWLNLLTDGLLGLGLGVERAERNVMRRPPYAPGEGIFARGMARHIVWVGLLIGGVALGLGIYEWRTGNPAWQTIIFTALAFAQIGQALAIRSGHDSLFAIGLRSNPALLGTILLTFALQPLVIYWAPLGGVFGTTALAPFDLALCIGAGLAVFAILELEKWWGRRGTAAHPERAVAQVSG